jgi:hypothetical protein
VPLSWLIWCNGCWGRTYTVNRSSQFSGQLDATAAFVKIVVLVSIPKRGPSPFFEGLRTGFFAFDILGQHLSSTAEESYCARLPRRHFDEIVTFW